MPPCTPHIVAPQPEAAEAGALVLRDGGNAVDAAVACALVQTVCDPQMCGIGGFGTMQIYLPERKVHVCVDFHAVAPSACTADMWEAALEAETWDGFGFIIDGKWNEIGHQSVAVPGTMLGLYEAATEFGTLPWARLVQPAIDVADKGAKVTPAHVAWWKSGMGEQPAVRVPEADKLAFTATGRSVYFSGGEQLREVGDIMPNPDYAACLRIIQREGADAFYRGSIAKKIAADFAAGRGASGPLPPGAPRLSAADLESYRTVRSEPLASEYRGHAVYGCQPPAGSAMVASMLNILDLFDLVALGHNTAEYVATIAEAMKYATIDKDTKLGDPAFVDTSRFAEVLSAAAAEERAEAIRRGVKATVERLGGDAAEGPPTQPESNDTTHVSVVDVQGGAVTCTHSLGMPSGVITDGLGFMFNGCMAVFDPRPGRAGSLAPGKRRFTSMSPTIVLPPPTTTAPAAAAEWPAPLLVIGAPGGSQISTGVCQCLLNSIDWGMSMCEAIAAPRMTCNADRIDVCGRVPELTTQALTSAPFGYEVRRWDEPQAFSRPQGIEVGADGDTAGGSDITTSGMALKVLGDGKIVTGTVPLRHRRRADSSHASSSPRL